MKALGKVEAGNSWKLGEKRILIFDHGLSYGHSIKGGFIVPILNVRVIAQIKL